MGLFAGLESLGFADAENKYNDLYKRDDVKINKSQPEKTAQKNDPLEFLYPKEFNCPVCGKNFINFIIRKSRLRVKDSDLDLKTNYLFINANCYDVYVCPHCGYASLAPYFSRITDSQRETIIQMISINYKTKEYPAPLSLKDAAERYKLALLNAVVAKAKAGQKAITCLKTAWVYRDMSDKENEMLFLNNALTGLKEAFSTESFPIGAMDEMTVKYMIGELARRTGSFQEAMKWIGDVVVSRNVTKTLKDRASIVKDLIRAGDSN